MQAHIPIDLMRKGNKAAEISLHQIPSPQQAVESYRRNGGRITDPGQEVQDPLFNVTKKCEIRFQAFSKKFPSFDTILNFYEVVNENPATFIEALNFFY